MTWGSLIANALIGGWVTMRALQAINRLSATEDEEAALRDRRRRELEADGPPQGGLHHVVHRGPVTFIYRFSVGEDESTGATGESGAQPEAICMDVLRLTLGLVDRDFTDDDYEVLSALDRDVDGRGAPVSQEVLDSLPQHSFRNRQQVASTTVSGSSTSAPLDSKASRDSNRASDYHLALQEKYGGDNSSSNSSSSNCNSFLPSFLRRRNSSGQRHRKPDATAAGSIGHDGDSASVQLPSAPPQPSGIPGPQASGHGSSEMQKCSICLEDFQEGDQVMSSSLKPDVAVCHLVVSFRLITTNLRYPVAKIYQKLILGS